MRPRPRTKSRSFTPDRVPLSFRPGAARGAPAQQHGHRHHLPQAPHGGLQRAFPIGWDAFGLPTENYAIKTGIHPAKVTHDNINRFREQLQRLGFSFDYTREVNTTDPDYYKWTQWIFLKFFEKGLAYKAEIPINFCTSCKVGLANEEVVDGVCERCGGPVVQKAIRISIRCARSGC